MSGRDVRSAPDFTARSAHLSQTFRQRRIRAGLSQQEVATAARLSIGTLRKIESNTTQDPGIFTVLSLASALALDLTDLLDPATEITEPSE